MENENSSDNKFFGFDKPRWGRRITVGTDETKLFIDAIIPHDRPINSHNEQVAAHTDVKKA